MLRNILYYAMQTCFPRSLHNSSEIAESFWLFPMHGTPGLCGGARESDGSSLSHCRQGSVHFSFCHKTGEQCFILQRGRTRAKQMVVLAIKICRKLYRSEALGLSAWPTPAAKSMTSSRPAEGSLSEPVLCS